MTVEEEARIARAAIEDAVDPLDPGPFAPRRPGAPVAALVVVVAALAGALLAATTLIGGGERDDALEAADPTSVADASATNDSAEVEDEDEAPADADADVEAGQGYWVLDPAPEGLQPFVFPDTAREGIAVTFDIYGRAGADNPFVDGVLIHGRGIGVPADEVAGDGEPVAIGETTAYATPGALEWYAPDGSANLLASDTLDAERLVELAAESLERGAIRGSGFDPLVEDFTFQSWTAAVSYGSPDGDDPLRLGLYSVGGADDLAVFTAAMGAFDAIEMGESATAAEAWDAVVREDRLVDDVGEVTITRGDGQVTVTGPIDGSFVTLAFSNPHTSLTTDADVEQSLEFFASIRAATADEVAAMRERGEAVWAGQGLSSDDPTANANDAGPYDGITDEGVAWQIIEDEDGVSCVVVTDGVSTAVCDFRDVVAEDGTTWWVSEGEITVLVLPFSGERERGVRGFYADGTTAAVIPYERRGELLWYAVQREPVTAIEFLDPDDQPYQLAVPTTAPADLYVVLAEPLPPSP